MRETTGRRRRPWAGVVAGALCVLLIWGVVEVVKVVRDMQGYGNPSAQEIEEALMEMRARASFEEMQGVTSVVLTEIRAGLEGDFGPIIWEHDAVDYDILGCTNAESENLGARSEQSRSFGFLSLDAAQTERAIEIVSSIARRNGYTRSVRKTAVSGTQYIDLATERGGRVTLVTGDPIGISVSTDCFLTAERLAELQSDD
ncbi:LppA family lipoprotein [Sanguibacter inulinus]|uniref:Uncharacterized protein n=1 Tax=Sanguibacter inulinus TaxID=60922 RepID=A0A853F0K9_9MICO|nr:LppA family lipoprotein [Sanguibacter inulinus]MBF0723453.1 hypothetical protein [Sanguibacter inulinus]NYS94598.1 hypothetical protein [Sanguibacter inulinus]